MSKLFRYHRLEDICFVTSVTLNREKVLFDNATLLEESFEQLSKRYGFEIVAYSILPEHFHALVNCNGNDLATIMQKVKLSFSKRYRNNAEIKKGQIWQRRYWDHIIRNESDFNTHIDYIHYNPVKHNLVMRPFEWEFSSIHEYKKMYQDDWGIKNKLQFDEDFGE